MTSPPSRMRLTADNPGSLDRVGAPEQDHTVWDVISELFPYIKSDPTGRAALRKIQKNIGWFEPDAQVEMRIKSPSRGAIIINLDQTLAGYVSELISVMAETPLPKTRSGRGYNARLKKNTPTAVEFGDMNSSRGLTENTTI